MIRRLPWLLLPLGALFLDWASKAWILSHLAPHASRTIIKDFFHLTLGFNPGAIFGTLAGAPAGVRTVVFTLAGVGAVLYFGWEFLRESTPTLQRWGLGLVLGGALGNGLDRFLRGAVVDFLDFEFGGWHYWTFNLADTFIVCGGVLLGLGILRSSLRQREALRASEETDRP